MIAKSICKKCWGKNWGSEPDESWLCKMIGNSGDVVWEKTSDIPKKCPYKFEQALALGLEDVR